MEIVTRAQMRQIEENSLRYDLTFYRLMENAGSAAAAFIRRTFPVEGRQCVIFCARGNNGGDGFVVARKLLEHGALVTVVLLDGVPEGADALSMYNTAVLMEIPMLDYSTQRHEVSMVLKDCDIIVDAICGTGFHGSLRPLHREACMAINSAIAAVVSLDIPTGLECDTGKADPDAVSADFTVVFDSKKPVHIFTGWETHCGAVEVVDIGIPPEAKEGIGTPFGTLDLKRTLAALPVRPTDSHKGSFGRVLIVAGCAQYRGAAALCALASLRSGSGLTVLASTETVCAAASPQLPEAILCPLPHNQEGFIHSEDAWPILQSQIQKADSIVFGCGLGDTSDTATLLELIVQEATCPVVVDADGINALSQHIHVLQSAQAPVILTPHPGEMARLLDVPVQEISEERQQCAMAFAADHKVTLVLKGAGTLVAPAHGGLFINSTGNPGLSKGGSGDVLAGMIGAFLAQGLSPEDAAGCGVFLHGLAADRTAERMGQYAMLPREILKELAGIFMENGR